MKNLTYIFDLDGTLADITHRLHYITGVEKDWDAFFAACEDDAPIGPTMMLLDSILANGLGVEIWTGRSSAVREQTERWLNKHGVYGVKVVMREEGDHRHDTVIKKEWLDALPGICRAKIAAVFEDRASVVKMWRDSGLVCYQVAPGDF